MVDWNAYEPFDPGIVGPPEEQPRAKAKAAYDRLMAHRGERIEQLFKLLRKNLVPADDDDDAIQAINEWFVDNVEPHPKRKRV
jgi:hypothetical protein